jgi:hypothetical protein
MSALEQEIMDRFHQLEPAAKQRILNLMQEEVVTETKTSEAAFDYEAWWADVHALQASIRSHLSEGEVVGALSMLDELREEES